MKRAILITVGILTSVVICIVIGLYFLLKPFEEIYNEEPVEKTIVMESGQKIYVRGLYRGITGDYQEIVFSETPITVPDKEKDYIFYTDEVFYKVNDNSLDIYACDCDTSEPKTTFNGVNIVLNDLKTSNKIKDYSTNYRKYGLEKISIHD